ncbi:MAG TPA: ATP-binding protein [Gemmataceae bacterium]|nr:ATP-binding protein [Gemmataceae bacterium]
MMAHLNQAQQKAFDVLQHAHPIGNVFVLHGDAGMGKTTVLREAHRSHGGAFLSMNTFLDTMQAKHPLALEETFEQWVRQALEQNTCVFVDDLHLLQGVVEGCGTYPRSGLINMPLNALSVLAGQANKKLFFATEGHIPPPLFARCYRAGIGGFDIEDYAFLCRHYLNDDSAERLDYAKIHRFAPVLNAHQLKNSCLWLRREPDLTTERFLDYLRSQHLASNVDLSEVQPVSLRDLQGVDSVIESLEANIVLPLENDELATEFGLKPKRGVLLAGPPGTGKTTVGRALAHRLQSKFFLIDGTFISGTGRFYAQIHYVFEEAKRNAPAIIFIDDSDVIFESGEELGLYRYLLTMLDGLESASAARVCVMLTAMDVSSLPPALIRSGRIELWLEMPLPDETAREHILRQHIGHSSALTGLDLAALVRASEGFTGADLKRLIEDGKNLLAYDRARQRPPRETLAYFLEAVETLRTNKERYAQAEAQARQQRPSRPVYYELAGDGVG